MSRLPEVGCSHAPAVGPVLLCRSDVAEISNTIINDQVWLWMFVLLIFLGDKFWVVGWQEAISYLQPLLHPAYASLWKTVADGGWGRGAGGEDLQGELKGGEQCWLLELDPCVSCDFRIQFSSTHSGNKETSDLVGETCTKSDILFSKTSLLSNSISGLSEDRKHRSVLKQPTIEEAVLRAEIALVVLFQDLNPFWNLFTYNSSILWASIPVHISLHFEELFFFFL